MQVMKLVRGIPENFETFEHAQGATCGVRTMVTSTRSNKAGLLWITMKQTGTGVDVMSQVVIL